MGARVIATTRFPSDALKRFKNEPDSAKWMLNLEVVGLDFRFVGAVEQFCSYLLEKEEHLDVVINNAAQTIRRPAVYYKHLLEGEAFKTTSLSMSSSSRNALRDEPAVDKFASSSCLPPPSVESVASLCKFDAGTDPLLAVLSNLAPITSAEASQLVVLPNDQLEDDTNFPAGEFDAQGQQLDRRVKNSWKLKLEEVSGREALEVFFINVVAPFILNSRLLPLLRKSPNQDRYVVNVSAMEGKFTRQKTCFHPHTNMAKAALNMMTRTCAADLAFNSSIFMTSVDTGWINDEHPLPVALRRAERGFQTPLDEIDAAARVLDPIITGIRFTSAGVPRQLPARSVQEQPDPSMGPVWGVFLKDYNRTEW